MPNTSKLVEIDHIKENLIELLSVGVRCPITVRCDACKYHDLDRIGFCNEEAATADMLIANGVTIQEWIPVTERLPEKGGSYLVFSSKSKTVFTAHYWLGDRWANRANGQFITHWMPLPEAPKGD